MREPSKRVLLLCGALTVAAVGTAVYFSAEDKPAVMSGDNAEFFESQTFNDAVDFYAATCSLVTAMQSSSDRLSIAVEDAVGLDPQQQMEARVSAVTDTADTISRQQALFEDNAWPTEMANAADSTKPFDYTNARDNILRSASDTIEALRSSTDLKGGIADMQQLNSESESMFTAVQKTSERSGELFQSVLDDAPIPNQKTLDAIKASQHCSGIFKNKNSDVGEAIYEPYVDAVAAMRQAHQQFSDSLQQFSQQREYTSDEEALASLSGMVTSAADAAQSSVGVFDAWLRNNSNQSLYKKQSHNARDAYDAIAVSLRSLNIRVLSKSDVQSAMSDVSTTVQSVVNDEAREWLRFSREVTPPNTASARAADLT